MDNRQKCKGQEARPEERGANHSKNSTQGAIKKKSSGKSSKGTSGANSVDNKSRKDSAGQQVKRNRNVKSAETGVNAASAHSGRKVEIPHEEWPPLQPPGGWDRQSKGVYKKHREPAVRPSVGSPAPQPKSSGISTPDLACGNADTTRSATPRTPASSKKLRQKAKSPHKSLKFEPYIPLFEVQQGLKRGEFIEGALRINPRNYEDAYVNSPDGQMDIYIGGTRDRNRALNGDLVVVQVNPKQEWKVLCDAIKDYQGKHGQIFVEEVYSPVSTPCKIHTPEKFSKLPSGASSMWNEAAGPRLPDSLQIMGVDKLAEQLGELSVQPKRKNRSKRHRIKDKNKSSTSSKESSNPQSSTTSYSHGSSDDILSRMSSDNTPEHHSGFPGIASVGVAHDSIELEENSNVNGYCTEQNLVDLNGSDNVVPSSTCTNHENINSSSENPWNAPDSSLSILIYPDALLDFRNDNPLQQFCEQYCSPNTTVPDHDGAIIVAPHDLSGDEFTDSASTSSSPTHLVEQTIEDSEFFASQQDMQNNNADDLWNRPVEVNDTDYISSNLIKTESLPSEKFVTIATDCKRELDVPVGVSSPGVVLMPLSQEIYVEGGHESTFGHLVTARTESSSMSCVIPKSPTFKVSKHTKKSSNEGAKLKKKKKTRLRKPDAKVHVQSGNEAPAVIKRDVGSLTVEEVMKHPLWPKFVQKTGKVVHILERKHSSVAMGHIKLFQDKNPRYALFSPKDNRLPRLMVPMSDCPRNFYERPQDFKHFLYLAEIQDWREDATFAFGRLTKNLGDVREISTHTEGILRENGVDSSDFPPEVTACLPETQNWTIPDSEFSRRVDCRKQCIFTIDPSTARDMDDAVSCELLENGNYEIGVHIADVTYFVHEDTVLDNWARDRATSVYLVQMVVPMLPRVLCDDLCSLNPGKDRLTFSVFWEMTPQSEVMNHRFEHTIINSCVKLSYEHAQEMIDNPSKMWNSDEHPPLYGGFTIFDVVARVNHLYQLSKLLRCKRFQDGALQLDQTKLQFSLNLETGYPLGFKAYKQKDSNRLIEEFMLLANMSVAEQIYSAFPKLALLRRHPPPQVKPMEDVVAACAHMGIHLDNSSSGALQNSISRYYGDDELSQARHLVLTNLCSKPMNCALYFCTGILKDEELFHHYALSVPFYTHFTSPIRRYPDIIVHRLLSASLGDYQPPKIKSSVMQKQAEHCNTKKYNAKRISELSDELFLAAFVLQAGPLPAQAMVINVLDHSFDCLVLHFGIVKRIYCDKLPLAQRKYQKVQGVQSLTLLWEDQRSGNKLPQTILMFSLVDVTLSTNNELQIVATLKMPTVKPLVDIH